MNEDSLQKLIRYVVCQGLLNGSLTEFTPKGVRDYLELLLLQQLILNKIHGIDEYIQKKELIDSYMKRFEGE